MFRCINSVKVKKVLLFLFVLLLSCSDDRSKVQKIENILEIDVLENYKKLDYSTEVGIGESLEVIDIFLERKILKY